MWLILPRHVAPGKDDDSTAIHRSQR
jgi:hypothetical protein